MKKSVGLAAIAAVFAASIVTVSATAEAGDFGAIAYSETTGAFGWASGYDSQDIAESVALRRCAEHAQNCYIAVQVQNGCAALARGARVGSVVHAGWAWASGQGGESANKGVAERNALTNCSSRTTGCVVEASICNGRQ